MTKAKQAKLADQDRIDLYEDTAREFFRTVLDLSYGEILVMDESWLSDFSSCGMPDEVADSTHGIKELYAAWRVWVVPVIKERYGLADVNARIPLVELFEKLEQQRCAPRTQ